MQVCIRACVCTFLFRLLLIMRQVCWGQGKRCRHLREFAHRILVGVELACSIIISLGTAACIIHAQCSSCIPHEGSK